MGVLGGRLERSRRGGQAGPGAPDRRPVEDDAATNPILVWQQAVGNQVVQRRLRADTAGRPPAVAAAAGGRSSVSSPPLAPLPVQRDGVAPHEDPLIKTRADAVIRVWQDTKKKDLVLAHLRRTDLPKDAPSELKLTECLVRVFAGDADGLWLASTLQEHGPEPLWDSALLAERRRHTMAPASGVIGLSSGLVKGSAPAPITAFFFPGRSDERALVIGGVHGSELSGIEVAARLVKSLQERAEQKKPPPFFTTIVVPELFPDTAALARRSPSTTAKDSNVGREVAVPRTASKGSKELPPARQFPPPGKGLSDLEAAGGPVDATGKRLEDDEGVAIPLMAESKALLALIERFRPSRIASIHAHRFDEEKGAKKGTDAPGIFVDPRGGFDKTVDPAFPKQSKGKLTAGSSPVTAVTKEGKADDALALAMAKAAKAGGARVPGNYLDDKAGPPVVHYAESAGHPEGFSLGDWGPSQGMTVITVEVQHYFESGGEAARAGELKGHSDALRDVFLEQ